MPVLTATLRGKRWTIDQTELGGYCDERAREINLNPAAKGEEALVYTIHEALHAEFPDEREKSIERAAKELARLLWRMVY